MLTLALALSISLSLSQAPAPAPPPMPQAEIDAARKLERDARDLQRQGRYLDAEQRLQQAIAIWARYRGPDDIEVLNDTMNLAVARRRRGDAAGAVPLLQKTVEGLSRCKDPDAPELRRRAVNNLAMAYQHAGQPKQASAAWEGLLQQLRAAGPEAAEEQARVLDNLASLLLEAGDLAAAEQHAKQGYAAWRALRGEGDDPDVAISASILGSIATARGDLTTARRHLEESLRVHESIGGRENPNVAATLNLLGALEVREGHRDAARAAYQRSLEISRALQLDPRNRLVVEAEQGLRALGAPTDARR